MFPARFVFAVAFWLAPTAAFASDPLAGLDEQITQAMKDHEVPGLARQARLQVLDYVRTRRRREDLGTEAGREGEKIELNRKADAATVVAEIKLTEAELKRYVGVYESKEPPIEVSVELIGGKLKMVPAGKPALPLAAVKEHKFKVAVDSVDARIEFEMAGDNVKSLTLEQGKMILKFGPKKR